MGEATTMAPRRMLVRIGIALAQGLLLWWLHDLAINDLWPVDRRGWLVGLIAATVLVPPAHYLITDLAPAARQWPVLAALGLLALGLGWHHGAWTSSEPYDGPFSFAIPFVVLVFHALPFVQSWLSRGDFRPRYGDLFHFAWRNALLGALGAVFAGVFWLLLMLWGELFRMLDIEVFSDLFQSSPFAIPATTVAVGVGMQLAGSVERLQSALRQQVLALLKWLAPLAILILVLFTVSLLAKSPELFSEQRRAISAVWLLWLVAVTVALLNSAYQDGSDDSPYPRWLGAGIRVATVLLLPVALLAMYALGVRIDAYGLTASRAWGLLVAVIALAYAGGYAWAALRRGAWMSGIGAVNVAIALLTIAMLTLMLTPLLSPERLAARSQYRRALADPEGDSYGELRFQSGRYGRERLAELAAIEDHAAAADIRARAADEIDREVPWQGPLSSYRLAAEKLATFPKGTRLDPGMIAALNASTDAQVLGYCTQDEPCPVLFTDLNRDGSEDVILFAPYGVVGATRRAGEWHVLNRMVPSGAAFSVSDRETVTRALAAGNYRIKDLPWQAIEIDGEYYVLTESKGGEEPRGESSAAVSRDPKAHPPGP
jgi:hypothetical protein